MKLELELKLTSFVSIENFTFFIFDKDSLSILFSLNSTDLQIFILGFTFEFVFEHLKVKSKFLFVFSNEFSKLACFLLNEKLIIFGFLYLHIFLFFKLLILLKLFLFSFFN